MNVIIDAVALGLNVLFHFLTNFVFCALCVWVGVCLLRGALRCSSVPLWMVSFVNFCVTKSQIISLSLQVLVGIVIVVAGFFFFEKWSSLQQKATAKEWRERNREREQERYYVMGLCILSFFFTMYIEIYRRPAKQEITTVETYFERRALCINQMRVRVCLIFNFITFFSWFLFFFKEEQWRDFRWCWQRSARWISIDNLWIMRDVKKSNNSEK